MRERLPNRRRCETRVIRWPAPGGRPVAVSAGLSPDNRILEVFVTPAGQSGSDLAFLMNDASILISRGLQFGDRVEDMQRGLSRTSTGEPASLIGSVLDVLAEMEAGS